MLEKVYHSEEIAEVFICLIKGNTYSSSIAEKLKKDYTTVSRQLLDLEKAGLIKKSLRDKAQHFELNREGLFRAWLKVFKRYNGSFSKPIDLTEFENYINDRQIQNFLMKYLESWEDEQIRYLNITGNFTLFTLFTQELCSALGGLWGDDYDELVKKAPKGKKEFIDKFEKFTRLITDNFQIAVSHEVVMNALERTEF